MLIKPSVCLSLLLFLILTLPLVAHGDQSVILNIILNQEAKGDFVVTMTDEHDFLVKVEDLKQMGFKEPSGTVYEIESERYVALGSIRGVGFNLDEKKLTLEITALPALLKNRVVDFSSGRHRGAIFTDDTVGFLNYRLDYSRFSAIDSQRIDLTNQIGFNRHHFLFLSDSSYTQTPDNRQLIRLMSSLTYDRPIEMQRAVAGDFFAKSGELGSSVNLGGISFSKSYLMDPYFIQYPQIDFSGAVSLPSELDVYLDGTMIRREHLSPGEFQLQNILSRAGTGTLELVLKDLFGKEERIRYPFYLASNLLKSSIHDYSYNLGFMRENFGEESFKYGRIAFSGYHRYGLSDSITAGFAAEASGGIYNLGPTVSVRLLESGVIDLILAGSQNSEGHPGEAASFNYTYLSPMVNGHITLQGYSENYSRISEPTNAVKKKFETTIGIGTGTKDIGFVTLEYGMDLYYIGQDLRTITVSYSRNLNVRSTILTSYKELMTDPSSYEIMVLLQYFPGYDTNISSRYEKTKNAQTGTVQIQKNPPAGEGIGGQLQFQRSDVDSKVSNMVDGSAQYNLKYGILTAEYRQNEQDNFSHLSASGGIAYIAGTVGLSRPITDAFALVQVDDLSGVRVYQNNQEIGRTNSSGKLFVPNLSSYYDNQISINEHDIPMDRSINQVEKIIVPPLRGGSYVPFDAKKFQGITGKIHVLSDGKTKAVEFHEIKLVSDKTETTFPTGTDGEFYIENAAPGIYKASFDYLETTCAFDLEIPVSLEPLLDLGVFLCGKNP
jgi:outer membrane usher protein